MFILGRTGLPYARLTFAAGPGGALLLPTVVDWSAWPAWLASHPGGLDRQVQSWRDEYAAHVQTLQERPVTLIKHPPPRHRGRRRGRPGPGPNNGTTCSTNPRGRSTMSMTRPSEVPLRDRDVRQREIVPPDRLATCRAFHRRGGHRSAGGPATGRRRRAAADPVRPGHRRRGEPGDAGLRAGELGRLKVEATAAACRRLNPDLWVAALPERFRRSWALDLVGTGNLIFFACVGQIATRKLVWESCCQTAACSLTTA